MSVQDLTIPATWFGMLGMDCAVYLSYLQKTRDWCGRIQNESFFPPSLGAQAVDLGLSEKRLRALKKKLIALKLLKEQKSQTFPTQIIYQLQIDEVLLVNPSRLIFNSLSKQNRGRNKW